MKKSVVLLERPVRREFDASMRARVEEILRARMKESPVPITPRWHLEKPILRLETKFVTWDIQFGPQTFRVEATLSAIGRFLDTKASRRNALEFVNEVADAVGI